MSGLVSVVITMSHGGDWENEACWEGRGRGFSSGRCSMVRNQGELTLRGHEGAVIAGGGREGASSSEVVIAEGAHTDHARLAVNVVSD